MENSSLIGVTYISNKENYRKLKKFLDMILMENLLTPLDNSIA